VVTSVLPVVILAPEFDSLSEIFYKLSYFGNLRMFWLIIYTKFEVDTIIYCQVIAFSSYLVTLIVDPVSTLCDLCRCRFSPHI